MDDRTRRAEERKEIRERDKQAKLNGTHMLTEKRMKIDSVYGKLEAVLKSLDAGVLKEDLWVSDGPRYSRIAAGSEVMLIPEVNPEELIARVNGDAAKDALCRQEQGRVYAQSGTWLDSEAASRAGERIKHQKVASEKTTIEMPPWSDEPYYEIRDWSGCDWPYCLLCKKFADEDHVNSEKHRKRVPYYLEYLAPSVVMGASLTGSTCTPGASPNTGTYAQNPYAQAVGSAYSPGFTNRGPGMASNVSMSNAPSGIPPAFGAAAAMQSNLSDPRMYQEYAPSRIPPALGAAAAMQSNLSDPRMYQEYAPSGIPPAHGAAAAMQSNLSDPRMYQEYAPSVIPPALGGAAGMQSNMSDARMHQEYAPSGIHPVPCWSAGASPDLSDTRMQQEYAPSAIPPAPGRSAGGPPDLSDVRMHQEYAPSGIQPVPCWSAGASPDLSDTRTQQEYAPSAIPPAPGRSAGAPPDLSDMRTYQEYALSGIPPLPRPSAGGPPDLSDVRMHQEYAPPGIPSVPEWSAGVPPNVSDIHRYKEYVPSESMPTSERTEPVCRPRPPTPPIPNSTQASALSSSACPNEGAVSNGTDGKGDEPPENTERNGRVDKKVDEDDGDDGTWYKWEPYKWQGRVKCDWCSCTCNGWSTKNGWDAWNSDWAQNGWRSGWQDYSQSWK